MRYQFIFSYLFLLCMAVSCGPRVAKPTPQEIKKAASAAREKKLVVGMSEDEVSRILGIPSLISKDARGRDVWMYEKAAKAVSHSPDQRDVWLVIGIDPKETAASKPITLVVKFDGGVISDVTYHSSQISTP